MSTPDSRLSHFDSATGNPLSYSQAVSFGDLIFTCGQLGSDPGADPTPFEAQARLGIRRLLDTVEAAGGGVETILKINAYLASLDDFAVYDAVYRELIGVDPKPARTTVEITRFPAPILIELDAVATRRRA